MSNTIDIDGLDLVELVQALYAETRPVGLGFLHDVSAGPSRKDVESLLEASTRKRGEREIIRLDYVFGRPFKLDICDGGKTLDGERLFDRDSYPGACRGVVERLRAKKASGATPER